MSQRLEAQKIATRYAKALFDTVLEQSNLGPSALDGVQQDLERVGLVLAEHPALQGFLNDPVVLSREKQDLIESTFGAGSAVPLSQTVFKLLQSLIENNRFSSFSALVDQFVFARSRYENTATAEVITATELEEGLRSRLASTLASTFGFNRVDLMNRVDPGILGGAVVKLHDQVIDGSYIGRLEALRKRLA